MLLLFWHGLPAPVRKNFMFWFGRHTLPHPAQGTPIGLLLTLTREI
jgi:hypothetical protein